MNYVDHVLLGVRDLDAGAARLKREYGWATLPGGSPAPGLENASVALTPPTYLELITATDPSASRPAATARGVDRAGRQTVHLGDRA
jgi:hypothetical protein